MTQMKNSCSAQDAYPGCIRSIEENACVLIVKPIFPKKVLLKIVTNDVQLPRDLDMLQQWPKF
jgi:hypothetical protein